MQPEKAVLTAALVTSASTVGASMLPADYGGRGELPSARLLIGTSLAFMGLGIITDIAPRVGVGLAASMAITALTYYGVPIADAYFTSTPKGKT